ncbi:hypothetical protein AB0I51_01100 [Streptomyces sp. NPDC050549]
MADWHWELFQDDMLDALPDAARAETERPANEIAARTIPVRPDRPA